MLLFFSINWHFKKNIRAGKRFSHRGIWKSVTTAIDRICNWSLRSNVHTQGLLFSPGWTALGRGCESRELEKNNKAIRYAPDSLRYRYAINCGLVECRFECKCHLVEVEHQTVHFKKAVPLPFVNSFDVFLCILLCGIYQQHSLPHHKWFTR